VIATKGGLERTGPGQWPVNGRPEHLIEACEGSLRRLKVDQIPLYQFHRPDPDVPLEDSIGALVTLKEQGKIRHIGLSNGTGPALPGSAPADRARVAAGPVAGHPADPRHRLGVTPGRQHRGRVDQADTGGDRLGDRQRRLNGLRPLVILGVRPRLLARSPGMPSAYELLAAARLPAATTAAESEAMS
jgi:hypothetical protein